MGAKTRIRSRGGQGTNPREARKCEDKLSKREELFLLGQQASTGEVVGCSGARVAVAARWTQRPTASLEKTVLEIYCNSPKLSHCCQAPCFSGAIWW